MNTTQIKDGLILLLIAGVALGGYLVARKVIDGVGSIGQGASEVIDSIKAGAGAIVDTVSTAAATAVEHGTLAPRIKPSDLSGLSQYEIDNIERMAAGGMGA